MPDMAQILVVEDEPIIARNVADALEYAGHDVDVAHDGEEALKRADDLTPDLLLLDIRLPRMSGLDVLKTLRGRGARAPAIVMTAHGNVETAVEAMKAGAADFLTKPVDLKELQIVVDKTLSHQRVVENLDYFKSRERADSGVSTIVGQSRATQDLRALILRIGKSQALAGKHPPSVLITGETGTGKDLVARAIHYAGPRAAGPFVQVNCTAVPDQLFESELFGHVKGAFTSAQDTRRGLMELADGGTIFFDEIGHMNAALQAKLLTAIEQKMIRPVGGRKERQVDVHVISATNRDLEAAIESGDFRDDLYHRLRVVPITLVPLRDRVEDILPLTAHFIAMYASRFGVRIDGMTDEAVEVMQRYDWPGNVRELSHVLENAVLMADEPTLNVQHLNIRKLQRPPAVEVSLPGGLNINVDFESDRPILEDIEHTVIKAALEYSQHNLTRAARILGITRDAVRYRINKYHERHGNPPAA
ncbi:MAG: sigma-54-dependent Fis family transcriptional regulator [Phycisphaerales bacterium]|nr:MAG: sigma-54-dependent Fis family transcriptional regulator [Phycisphaerales bacterium]